MTEKPIVTPTTVGPPTTSTPTQVSPTIISSSNLDHTYDGFHFTEPEAPSSYLRKTTASHGGKASKSLTEAYDLPYELGADLFFSSLQLQSVSTGGKTGSVARQERSKEESWPAPRGDPLLKAVREQDEAVFKPLNFDHDSPEASEEEEDEEEHDDFDAEEEDEDYDVRRHSPPTVPATHTGGKWKPEHRPQLRHPHIERVSPSWDEPPEETYTHPPADHTKGFLNYFLAIKPRCSKCILLFSDYYERGRSGGHSFVHQVQCHDPGTREVYRAPETELSDDGETNCDSHNSWTTNHLHSHPSVADDHQ